MAEYIHRKALIDAIKRDCLEKVYYNKEDAINCIESMIAADVAPVAHGEWEKHMEYDYLAVRYFQAGFHCSCCGLWRLETRNLNYCPNCGAKMDLEG